MHEEDAELIDLIYAATLGERPWREFVERLAQTSPGGCAMLFSFDGRRGEQNVNILEGRPKEIKEGLEGHYGALNPYAPHCMVKPLGVGVVGDRMVARERLVRNEFYNDLMLKADVTATLGIAVDRSPECTILISTATRLNDEEEQNRLAAQQTHLGPHLRRAAAFYRRTAPSRMASELGASLFDAIDVGVLLVRPDLRLTSMSDAAKRIAGERLSFDVAGRLRLPGEDAQAALKAMCGRRYEGPQSLRFAEADLMLTLVRISRGGVIDLFDDCGVVVIVQAWGGGRRPDPEALRRRYGLTPAEARVLDGVMRGRTIDELARSAGRSRETIRSQLKSVYAKTGAGGRIDLLRRLAGPWS